MTVLAVIGGVAVVGSLGYGGWRAWRWVKGVARLP